MYSEAVRLLAATNSINNTEDGSTAPYRWLDIGTGTGLLASLVASRFPAAPKDTSKVFACEEVQEVAGVAARTFKSNGGGVRLFRRRSTELHVDSGDGGSRGTMMSSRASHVIMELFGSGKMRFFRDVYCSDYILGVTVCGYD